MKYIVKKDWNWFLAEVSWNDSLYAYWDTEKEAISELLNVIDMTMDYHLELVEQERSIKNLIIWDLWSKNLSYAV